MVTLLVAAVAGQSLASLEGRWRLNRELSDVSDGLRGSEARRPPGGRAPMGGPFGGPAGGPPLGGGGRQPADAQEMAQRTALLLELMTPRPVVQIDVAGDVVSFTDEQGHRTSYRTTGKAEKHQAINGNVETRTRWRRGVLERESRLDDGFRVTETFVLDPSGQLVVTAQLSGGRFGGERRPVRRVYDRLETAD